ncbi:hypothetical protein [Thalassospira lucentensis]|nr:hypothetical protein [Thalassospira lucentensis]NIZ03245.1 hypothetical protein [Thalassospira lucentensis]
MFSHAIILDYQVSERGVARPGWPESGSQSSVQETRTYRVQAHDASG